MLNVIDRMENIVWKGEYAGMPNFLISHNLLVETLILHHFAWETNSVTAFIYPTRFCFMQTTRTKCVYQMNFSKVENCSRDQTNMGHYNL